MTTPVPTSPAPQSKPPRRLRRVILLVAAMVPVGVLASALFSWQRRTRTLRETMQKGYEIHRLLVNHAAAHEGALVSRRPDGSPLNNSDEAFNAVLDPSADAGIFHLPGNPWHRGRGPATGAGPLKLGKNAWAYISGLNAGTSPGNLPLLAPGFDRTAPGFYHRDPTKPGGVAAKSPVVILRLNGSAVSMEVDGAGRVLETVGGKQIDIFSTAYGTVPKNILNPAR